jgi:hypothetical protein
LVLFFGSTLTRCSIGRCDDRGFSESSKTKLNSMPRDQRIK